MRVLAVFTSIFFNTFALALLQLLLVPVNCLVHREQARPVVRVATMIAAIWCIMRLSCVVIFTPVVSLLSFHLIILLFAPPLRRSAAAPLQTASSEYYHIDCGSPRSTFLAVLSVPCLAIFSAGLVLLTWAEVDPSLVSGYTLSCADRCASRTRQSNL